MNAVTTSTYIAATMPAETLRGIIAEAVKADAALGLAQSKHGKTYAALAAKLRGDIPTALKDSAVFSEYRRRVNEFATQVAHARMESYEGDDKAEAEARHVAAINKGVDRDNKKAAWVPPKAEKDESEKAEAARKAEANRKARERAVAKVMGQLRKQGNKADPKTLKKEAESLVKEQTAEQREEAREQGKFAANEAKYLEQLAAFNARMPEVFQADVREYQLQLAAVIANLKAVQTKA